MKKLNIGWISEKGNVINFVIGRNENPNFLHELELRIKNETPNSNLTFLLAVLEIMFDYSTLTGEHVIKRNLNQGNVNTLIQNEIRYLNEEIAKHY